MSVERRSRVLDTVTVSYLMRGDPNAVNRLESCCQSDVLIPQPVIAELSFGLARLPPSRRKSHLQYRFELILSEVLRAEWTDEVSFHFGASKAFLERAGQVIEDFDLAIAAHALAREAILVTSNRKHILPNLDLEDWGPDEGAAR